MNAEQPSPLPYLSSATPGVFVEEKFRRVHPLAWAAFFTGVIGQPVLFFGAIGLARAFPNPAAFLMIPLMAPFVTLFTATVAYRTMRREPHKWRGYRLCALAAGSTPCWIMVLMVVLALE